MTDDILKALETVVVLCGRTGDSLEDFEEVAALYQKETGRLRPGKDDPFCSMSNEERRKAYSDWLKTKLDFARSVLRNARAAK